MAFKYVPTLTLCGYGTIEDEVARGMQDWKLFATCRRTKAPNDRLNLIGASGTESRTKIFVINDKWKKDKIGI